MSNDQPAQGITVTDPRKEQVKFVTHLLVNGCANGVVNMTLGTAQFSTPDCLEVVTDLVVATRLRMDLFTAQVLRDALDDMIEKNTKPMPASKAN